MHSQELKKLNIPDNPGVYFFKEGNEVLYIGKATSLRDRVKSYFGSDLINTRGPLIVDMVFKVNKLDFQVTDSVLEALILEAELIKKYQPKYNTKEKDDKSFTFVIITDEDFPRVILLRGRDLQTKKDIKIKYQFGPFPHGSQLKEALKIVRHLFPFRSECHLGQIKPCFNYQIGLCPGVCAGLISKKDYAETIKNIKQFFSGQKKKILIDLNKKMSVLAKAQEFEKAAKVRQTIFALQHIQDVSLLKKEDESIQTSQNSFRIEAYDIAHLFGQQTVGAFTVWADGQLQKSEYRKFIIKTMAKGEVNDLAGLKEVLERRLKHQNWPLPQLIVVDGGLSQMNTAQAVLADFKLDIPVVAVTKDEHHKAKKLVGDRELVTKYKEAIVLVNSESHRYVISFHRTRRAKDFLK